jgi:hypothetical protein
MVRLIEAERRRMVSKGFREWEMQRFGERVESFNNV